MICGFVHYMHIGMSSWWKRCPTTLTIFLITHICAQLQPHSIKGLSAYTFFCETIRAVFLTSYYKALVLWSSNWFTDLVWFMLSVYFMLFAHRLTTSCLLTTSYLLFWICLLVWTIKLLFTWICVCICSLTHITQLWILPYKPN